jgi:phospholipid/cholesterol/gamma-HCH transport system permease protein
VPPALHRKAAGACRRGAASLSGRAGRALLAAAAGHAERWGFLGRTFLLGLEGTLAGHMNRRRLIWARITGEALQCFRASLFLASGLGLMAGFLWAIVWYGILSNIGGTETLVSLALRIQLNEVSPFLTAFVVTASYAGPSATRLARFRFSGCLDTLRLMGIPPSHLLAWPPFLGQLAAFPVLILFHCCFTVMGVWLGARAFASFPFTDFLGLLVSGVKAYSLFRMAVQSVLMSCALSFFSLQQPYRAPDGPGVEIPDLVRRGTIEGFFWASLSGILVSVLYA